MATLIKRIICVCEYPHDIKEVSQKDYCTLQRLGVKVTYDSRYLTITTNDSIIKYIHKDTSLYSLMGLQIHRWYKSHYFEISHELEQRLMVITRLQDDSK